MANTVNDVMNVIASPDYGIKNIAGTTHEILAIMQGTHNSQNNIHNIVNDVKVLLQKLVDGKETKKPINVNNNQPKITQKHIQDILAETKGIKAILLRLEKAMLKQSQSTNVGVAKLSSKASEKVAKAMIKNINKNSKDGGLSSIIDAFTKLKNIKIGDIIISKRKLKKIMSIFKNAKEELKIKEKDLDVIIKVINSAPNVIKNLSSIKGNVNKIIKNETIKKLNNILVGKMSLLSISKALKKNAKIFEAANKVGKTLKELISSLNKAMKKLFFTSLWAKFASDGVKRLDEVITKLISLSKKLSKNKKEFGDGSKAAAKITILTGNLLIASIFLAITAVFAYPALLGAKLLSKIVTKTISVAKKLSKNNKAIKNAIGSAIILAAFTGVIMITTVFLTAIAVTGVPALLGALIMVGIVKICSLTFKMLNEAKKNVLVGSLVMLVMSASLILFGIALKKITDATKGVSWKQFGMIAAFIGLFAASIGVMGIGPIAAAIALGSAVMTVMSISLILFGNALGKIAKATEKLTSKHISTVASSMWKLGLSVAGMGVLSIPIAVGSVALTTMGISLRIFVKTLKLIKDMGVIPMKGVTQVLKAMKMVGTFYAKNALSLKAVWNARRYKRMMRPFGKTIKHLSKLKQLGTIPMKLVYGALKAMSAIATYYVNNPIEKEVIKQARKYKRMMRPFGKTLKHLSKLKQMGTIPMKLVYGVLKAMSAIATYYVKNPIEREVLKQARRYKRMMRPFGKTIKHLSKLKQMGTIPMKLVHQALKAISTIANFYNGQKMGFFDGLKSKRSASMIARIVSSFGDAVKSLKDLKELRNIPTGAIIGTVDALSSIVWFFNTAKFKSNIKLKSFLTKYAVNEFVNMAMEIEDKLANVKPIELIGVYSVINACRYIINYYAFTKFIPTILRVDKMNNIIKRFISTAQDLKTVDFDVKGYSSVNRAINSMREIFKFLKRDTLNIVQRRRAKKNIGILSTMANIMSKLSKVDTSGISSMGGALSDALSGVNTVDLGQVIAVTNMFNAFGKISKSENIINKFTESVKEFTEACKDLMDAMGNNTDAINNMDVDRNNRQTSIFDTIRERANDVSADNSDANNTNTQLSGIRITNVDEMAKAIAEKINGSLSVDVSDTQVQLLINGTGGNEWIISRY